MVIAFRGTEPGLQAVWHLFFRFFDDFLVKNPDFLAIIRGFFAKFPCAILKTREISDISRGFCRISPIFQGAISRPYAAARAWAGSTKPRPPARRCPAFLPAPLRRPPGRSRRLDHAVRHVGHEFSAERTSWEQIFVPEPPRRLIRSLGKDRQRGRIFRPGWPIVNVLFTKEIL
jgi:hypothetical protein